MNETHKKKLQILADTWEEKARHAQASHPLKTLSTLPKMVGITPKTAKFLKAKGLFYLIWHDKNKVFLRHFFKKPINYTISLLRSYLKGKSFTRKGDLFFYGLQDKKEFKRLTSQEKTIVVLGFSYCHKPFECPAGRFTAACHNDTNNPICNQCFIGKCSTLAAHTKAQVFYIPTIHHIGEKLFEVIHQNPGRPVVFLITACEMSLQMFGDWGHMVQARGIGVRLDGRICNTMRAFHLSEKGIKPGLTVVLEKTQDTILDLIMGLHKDACVEKA